MTIDFSELEQEGQGIEEFVKELEEKTLGDGEKETPTESQSEEQPVEKQTQPPEDKQPEEQLPFHEHPRWKKMYSENRSLKEEIASIKEDMQSFSQNESQGEEPIPRWFSSILGDDKETWNEFLSWDNQRQQAYRENVLSELESQKTQEAESQKQWDSWLEENIEELKSEGKTFDRNKLLKVMLDFQPIDSEGNYDFRKGIQIYEMMEKSITKKMDSRKEIADLTSKDDKSGGPTQSKTVSLEEARKTGWNF